MPGKPPIATTTGGAAGDKRPPPSGSAWHAGVAALRLDMGADHRPQRQEWRQAGGQRRVAGARDVAVQHAVRRRPRRPADRDPSAGTRGRSPDRSSPSPRRIPAHRTAPGGRCQRQRLPRCRSPCARRTKPSRARRAASGAMPSSAARMRAAPGAHRRSGQAGVVRRPGIALGNVTHRRDGHPFRQRRQAAMERRDRVAERIEQCRRQPARRRDCVQEIACRHPRHAQHPVDAWPSPRSPSAERPSARRTTGTTSRYRPGAAGAVQLQFAPSETPARLQRREVEERQPHRLLQLPHRVRADEHQRDMRLQRVRPGEARAGTPRPPPVPAARSSSGQGNSLPIVQPPSGAACRRVRSCSRNGMFCQNSNRCGQRRG